jgi:hypothetical protein
MTKNKNLYKSNRYESTAQSFGLYVCFQIKQIHLLGFPKRTR